MLQVSLHSFTFGLARSISWEQRCRHGFNFSYGIQTGRQSDFDLSFEIEIVFNLSIYTNTDYSLKGSVD